MAEGDKSGLQTAIEAIGVGQAPTAGAEQLPLLPLPLVDSEAAIAEAAVHRGPGRPAGSRNKRTEEWVDYILGRYRSPLVVLAETYSRPVQELAKELGCTKAEAFDRQQAAARAILPYVHQEQPKALQLDGRGMMQLVIETGDYGEVEAADDGSIVLEAVAGPGEGESEEKQGVSGAASD